MINLQSDDLRARASRHNWLCAGLGPHAHVVQKKCEHYPRDIGTEGAVFEYCYTHFRPYAECELAPLKELVKQYDQLFRATTRGWSEDNLQTLAKLRKARRALEGGKS